MNKNIQKRIAVIQEVVLMLELCYLIHYLCFITSAVSMTTVFIKQHYRKVIISRIEST